MNTWKSYNFGGWFHPLNMQTGQNKKTFISYFSVLKNISKIQSNRRRAPIILMNFGGWFQPLNIEAGQNKKTRISYFSVL